MSKYERFNVQAAFQELKIQGDAPANHANSANQAGEISKLAKLAGPTPQNIKLESGERQRYETMRDCIRAVARAYARANLSVLSAQDIQRVAAMRVDTIADALAWRDAWLALLKRVGSKHGR